MLLFKVTLIYTFGHFMTRHCKHHLRRVAMYVIILDNLGIFTVNCVSKINCYNDFAAQPFY